MEPDDDVFSRKSVQLDGLLPKCSNFPTPLKPENLGKSPLKTTRKTHFFPLSVSMKIPEHVDEIFSRVFKKPEKS